MTESKKLNPLTPVLEVRNLSTEFKTDQGVVRAVDEVSFAVYPGKTLGIVGESGCGKSVTSLSIMRLIPQPPGRIVGGDILYKGKSLLSLKPREMRGLRGKDLAMIFQEPMTSLNPVYTIGNQISEAIAIHQNLNSSEIKARAIEMLKLVGIPAPEQRYDEYPHQLSGGMRQRVMIAMALSNDPKVLIADEPTTALDVTIQAQILTLLKSLQERVGMGMILITHDLGVVAEVCDHVVVMYAGRVVESSPVAELFSNPKHPYTQALLRSIPTLRNSPKSKDSVRLETIPGIVPNLLHLPQGCRFQDRCLFKQSECTVKEPELRAVAPGVLSRCIRDN